MRHFFSLIMASLAAFSSLTASAVTMPDVLPYREPEKERPEIIFPPDGQDVATVERLLEAGARQSRRSNLILFYGNALKGTRYVAKTLERYVKNEVVIVNLQELDCTTFVENVLALYLTTREGSKSFDDFMKNLERVRYRGGKNAGYASRNHYFSEWIVSNAAQGIVEEICGKADDKRGAYYPYTASQTLACNYMTQHPTQYPQLSLGDSRRKLLRQIRDNENRISGTTVRYIPKSRVGASKKELGIKDGDILAIVTNKKGLDTSHIGFAVWGGDKKLHLLNASQIHKKVVLEEKTLEQYMSEHPSQIGIRVIRVK